MAANGAKLTDPFEKHKRQAKLKDLINDLGTVAKNGTMNALEANEQGSVENLVNRFCVGFYSFCVCGLLKDRFYSPTWRRGLLKTLFYNLALSPSGCLLFWFPMVCVLHWLLKGRFYSPDVVSRVTKGFLLQPFLVTLRVPFVLASNCFCILWVAKGSVLQPDVAGC